MPDPLRRSRMVRLPGSVALALGAGVACEQGVFQQHRRQTIDDLDRIGCHTVDESLRISTAGTPAAAWWVATMPWCSTASQPQRLAVHCGKAAHAAMASRSSSAPSSGVTHPHDPRRELATIAVTESKVACREGARNRDRGLGVIGR